MVGLGTLLGGLWGLAAALLPGQYAGQTRAGAPLRLHLQADGQVRFQDQPWRWQADGDALVLRRGDVTQRWRVQITDDGAVVLTGPPFGEARLVPEAFDPPAPPPSTRPAPWVGAWIHRASGGALALHLAADGALRLGAPGGPQQAGTWRGSADGLVLVVDGGAPLRYTARREGPRLVLAGGDLPSAVTFEPVSGGTL